LKAGLKTGSKSVDAEGAKKGKKGRREMPNEKTWDRSKLTVEGVSVLLRSCCS
jgi:hypothetical protein